MLDRGKTSDRVAEILIARIVRGELRPGQRLDLEALAGELSVSRSPVREAVILLERDGLVDMPFHRGAFVGEIGRDAVEEGFRLYALLSGLTAHRAASKLQEEQTRELAQACARAIDSRSPEVYERHAREFRRVVNVATAGPHLKSLLRTFNGLVRGVSMLAIEADLEAEQQLLSAERDALSAGDAVASVEAAVRHVMDTGRRGVTALHTHGLFEDPTSDDAPHQETQVSVLSELVVGLESA